MPGGLKGHAVWILQRRAFCSTCTATALEPGRPEDPPSELSATPDVRLADWGRRSRGPRSSCLLAWGSLVKPSVLVLIAENEEEIRIILQASFEDGGFAVVLASTGEEAIAA